MYVDKPLSGVHAVQTLSRLNRIHPPHKDSTIVLDLPTRLSISRRLSSPYYEATLLSEGTDHNLPYFYARKLGDFHFYTQDEVDSFACAFFSEENETTQLYALLNPVVDRFTAPQKTNKRAFVAS